MPDCRTLKVCGIYYVADKESIYLHGDIFMYRDSCSENDSYLLEILGRLPKPRNYGVFLGFICIWVSVFLFVFISIL